MSLSLQDRLAATTPTTQSDVILTTICRERRGVVKREVRKLVFSMENINKFWEKSRKYPVLFNEEVSNDFKKFVEMFLRQVGDQFTMDGLFWVIDDFVGVYYLNHIVPEVDAQVHYSFFDGVQNGREELTKEMITYVFNRYEFHRLSVNIPCFANDPTFNFVERLGFKFEGKKRKAAKFNGDWFDVKMYGLLRENHLNGHSD